MINEKMYEYGSKSSVIRELFSYGLERKKVVGEDRSTISAWEIPAFLPLRR